MLEVRDEWIKHWIREGSSLTFERFAIFQVFEVVGNGVVNEIIEVMTNSSAEAEHM